jgi:ABC-type oligopeptide transport system substrate-binding subunit
MLFTADDEAHEQAASELQRYIVEQAFIIPLYTPTILNALNSDVQGTLFSPIVGNLELYDAYMETE